MFHEAGVFIRNVPRYPDHLQEFDQDIVTELDLLSDDPSRFGESDAFVFPIHDQTFFYPVSQTFPRRMKILHPVQPRHHGFLRILS